MTYAAFFLLPASLGINPRDLPDILSIPLLIGIMLAAVFYDPMIGLVRIVPALRIRAASTFFDPALAALTGFIYLAVFVICHSLGKKTRAKLKVPASPDAPPQEPGRQDTPQEDTRHTADGGPKS
ncbi:MAG TPA: hypothetical protein VN446_00520 [Candidatus Acidoferrum sp.]|nr:hypothetical protein [Candidatus Acidoferrum sp.]